jgi:hypothetical protein
MANIVNQYGQVKFGVRYTSAPLISPLWNNIYSVWNAETSLTTLATGVYSAWNGEGVVTPTQLSTSLSNAWQGGSSFPATNYSAITTSMINLWKGDGDFIDSIGGLTGTSPSTSAPTFTTGKIGTSAFTFDGVNDYIELPTGSLKFTGDFSVSMWVKGTNWTSSRTLISNADINNVGNKWNGWHIIVNTAGMVSFTQINNGVYNTILSSSVSLATGVWSLVTVTRTSTTSTMYINGSKVGSVTNTISIGYSTTNFPYIGSNRYLPGYPLQQCFLGSLDEIGIWSRALTDSEAIGLYENGNGQAYPYTNNTTVALDSFGTSNGILKNGVTFSTGKIGNAFLFNGSNYVDLPMGALNKTGDFSVSLWVYPTANTGNMQLISCGDGIKGWRIEYSGGNLWFWGHTSNATASTQLSTGHSIALNTWTHVLITFKVGGQAKSYINGALTNSVTAATIFYDNYSPYYLPLLGAQRYQNPYIVLADQRAFFTGKLDAIDLWDKELTSTDVLAIYNSGNGNEYPFSNVSVSSPNDAVSTKHGTNVGGVTYTQGVVGNAFTFNGSSNYVTLPNSSFDFTGDFSISAWVKIPSAPSATGYIFQNDNYDVATSYGYGLNVKTNRTISFYVGSTDGTSTVTSTTVLALNTWYHVTVTRDSVAKRSDLYINGVFEVQATNTNITIGYGTRAIQPTIGAYRGNNQGVLSVSNYLNGSVDALTIWNKKVSDDEIVQLYNMGGGIQHPFTTQTIRTPYSVYNGDNLIDPIGAKNATINGGVTYSAGKIGDAYTFDGTTGYLTLPSTSLNFQGKSFSFSMWLKFNGTPANQSAILSNCFTNKGFHLGVISNILYMSMGNGTGTAPQIQGPSVSEFTNKWGHVTFVWEHGVGMKFYLNGNLYNSVANTTTIDFTSLTTLPNIGRKVDGGGWSLLNGSIDGLTFWDSALTPPEILTLFNDANGMEYPYSSTITAKLPSFNDTIATNHGTSPVTATPTFTTGKIGKAFRFDGVNDHILLPSTALKFTGDFSVSLWVYIPLDSATNQTLIGCLRQPSVWRGWDINIYSNRIYFEAAGATSIKSYAYITSTNIAAWKHVVATFKNGTGGKLYVDNVLRGSFAMTETIVYDSVHTPSIGAMKYAPNTTWYVQNGTKMDAISTWTKELTATEITDLYNSGTGKQYPN